MVPFDLHVKGDCGEHHKHHQRDHLLQDLQLHQREWSAVALKADTVGGHLQAIFKNAMPHDNAITPIKGKVLNHENSAIFRWPYHASVINTFDAINNAIV